MKNEIIKSAIVAVMALFISVSSFAAPVNTALDAQGEKCELVAMEEIDINIWITSKEGCRFHIVGEFSVWDQTFSGSVSGTSNPPCPNGTWTFGLVVPSDGGIEVSGHPEIVDFLNSEPGLVREIAVAIGMIE